MGVSCHRWSGALPERGFKEDCGDRADPFSQGGRSVLVSEFEDDSAFHGDFGAVSIPKAGPSGGDDSDGVTGLALSPPKFRLAVFVDEVNEESCLPSAKEALKVDGEGDRPRRETLSEGVGGGEFDEADPEALDCVLCGGGALLSHGALLAEASTSAPSSNLGVAGEESRSRRESLSEGDDEGGLDAGDDCADALVGSQMANGGAGPDAFAWLLLPLELPGPHPFFTSGFVLLTPGIEVPIVEGASDDVD